MYKLVNEFTQGSYSVTVIGCGGTGSLAAEGLCRILPKEAKIILIDHDRVERRNLVRQNFFKDELGKFKSEALAVRLSDKYGRVIGYSMRMISGLDLSLPGIVVGCVDNGLARGDIAEKCNGRLAGFGFESWWVDSGNGENYGQVLIGNHLEAAYFNEEQDFCHVLPFLTVQRPELLYQLPVPELGCAQIEQGPTINQAMAFLVVEVVNRIIEGSCRWMQLYLDTEAGALRPVYAIPDSLRGLLKKNKIMKGGAPNERRS